MAYLTVFGRFWPFLGRFWPKKKCAAVPEAFWGWFEVVASGHGAVRTLRALFFAKNSATYLKKHVF